MIREISYGKRRKKSIPGRGNRWKKLSRNCSTKLAMPSASRAVAGQCKHYSIRTEQAYVNWIRLAPTGQTLRPPRYRKKPVGQSSAKTLGGFRQRRRRVACLVRSRYLARRQYFDVTRGCDALCARRCCNRVGKRPEHFSRLRSVSLAPPAPTCTACVASGTALLPDTARQGRWGRWRCGCRMELPVLKSERRLPTVTRFQVSIRTAPVV